MGPVGTWCNLQTWHIQVLNFLKTRLDCLSELLSVRIWSMSIRLNVCIWTIWSVGWTMMKFMSFSCLLWFLFFFKWQGSVCELYKTQAWNYTGAVASLALVLALVPLQKVLIDLLKIKWTFQNENGLALSKIKLQAWPESKCWMYFVCVLSQNV